MGSHGYIRGDEKMIGYILENKSLFITLLAVVTAVISVVILALITFNFNTRVKDIVNNFYLFYIILSLMFFVLIAGILVLDYKYKGGMWWVYLF